MSKESSIYKKLFEIQKKGIDIEKKTKAYKYKYATYCWIREIIDPYLSEQKLLVTHQPGYEIKEGILVRFVKTKVIDIETGEYVECNIFIDDKHYDPQDTGSLLTYYNRYGLCALLGLRLVNDNDGKIYSSQKQPISSTEGIPKNEFDNVFNYLKDCCAHNKEFSDDAMKRIKLKLKYMNINQKNIIENQLKLLGKSFN